jgi:pimeloyl-ACP methyl ester carboxylesterase
MRIEHSPKLKDPYDWNLVRPAPSHKVPLVMRPIVLLHGALGSAAQLGPIADELRALGPVHVLEFPGHGETALGATEFSIEGFAQFVGASLAARGLDRPRVFGYSMGGYVALALEAARPGTCGSIVTLGTKYAWTAVSAAREAAQLDADAIRATLPRFAAALEARHRIAGGWETLLVRTAALLHGLGSGAALDAGRLAAVRCPVCCAVGDRDSTVTVEETQALALAVRGNTEVLAGVQHPIERLPAGTATALMRSLGESATL